VWTLSVEVLARPQEVLLAEAHRVLRPGGQVLLSFSNRCFPSKAVAMWLAADDIGRMSIAASYLYYAA
jgi:SAM-dependent methyltransferase